MKEYVITDGEAGIRLDKQLFKILNLAGSGFVYKMLRKKNITLNGRKAEGNERLAEGDVIRIYLADETFVKFSSDRLPGGGLSVLSSNDDKNNEGALSDSIGNGALPSMRDITVYEDDKLLLVNKPAGILSQKAGPFDISINEMCLKYLIDKGELTPEKLKIFKPSVCNRLDRNTSGIIIFAKTYSMSAAINASLKDRSVHKYYLCIAEGRIKEGGSYTGWLVKDRGANKVFVSDKPIKGAAEIETVVSVLKCSESYTLLEVKLITGKSHQIRAQLAALGHPLLGDLKYGGANIKTGRSAQLLHAYKLVIPGEAAGELEYLAGRDFAAAPSYEMVNTIRDIFGVDINAYMEQQGSEGLNA